MSTKRSGAEVGGRVVRAAKVLLHKLPQYAGL